MKKMILIVLALCLVSVSAAYAVPAEVNPAVRALFTEGLAAGTPVEQLVADAMELGPNLDSVLALAQELGDQVDATSVFRALVNLGVEPAVLASSALSAGFSADQVASLMTATSPTGASYSAADVVVLAEALAGGDAPSSGLAYTPAETPPPAPPAPPASVGGSGRGTSVSPSQP